MPLSISDVESRGLGVRTARVADVAGGSLDELLREATREEVELLIARVEVGELRTAQTLESAGFRLMDTLIYYERDLQRRPPESLEVSGMRAADEGDLAAVAEIAREAFRDYQGHYQADPRIDPERAREGYVDWARRAVAGEAADRVMVHSGEAVDGFGTFRRHSDGRVEFVLAGVRPAAQGAGVYRAVAASGMLWAVETGAGAYFSSTQLTNLAVQKVWCRLGMEPSKAVYTFHRWMHD